MATLNARTQRHRDAREAAEGDVVQARPAAVHHRHAGAGHQRSVCRAHHVSCGWRQAQAALGTQGRGCAQNGGHCTSALHDTRDHKSTHPARPNAQLASQLEATQLAACVPLGVCLVELQGAGGGPPVRWHTTQGRSVSCLSSGLTSHIASGTVGRYRRSSSSSPASPSPPTGALLPAPPPAPPAAPPSSWSKAPPRGLRPCGRTPRPIALRGP